MTLPRAQPCHYSRKSVEPVVHVACESSCEITDDSIACGSNIPRSPIMNTSYFSPLFWMLIAGVVLDSISVLARNCSRLARNLALPCEKVGVESWSQARISTPGWDIANFYSCPRDNCSRFAMARQRTYNSRAPLG